jgi:hypothetical protein
MHFKTIVLAGIASAMLVASSGAATAGCDTRSSCKTSRSCSTTCDRPARAKFVRTPAVYKTVKKRVVVKRARTRYHYEPAVYKTVKKRVMVRRARTVVKYKPAVYKTVEQRHVKTSYRTRIVRKRSKDGCCVSRCRVKVPVKRVYTTRRRVMVSPAKTYRVHKPAEYITRTVNVRVSRGKLHRVTTPAVYGWRKEKVRVKRASIKRVASAPRSRCSTVRRSHRRSCR